MSKHGGSDLDGLAEAALSQHLSVDEVGWPENAVRPLGHPTERFWLTYVLLIGTWGRVNAVAAKKKREEKQSAEHPTMERRIICCPNIF